MDVSVPAWDLKPGDAVRVIWVDPRLFQEAGGWAWVYPEKDEIWDLPVFHTLGFVVMCNYEKLVVTPTKSFGMDGPIGPPLILPLGVIRLLVKLDFDSCSALEPAEE